MTRAVLPRDEIALEHTWAAESIFASLEAWESAFEAGEAEIAALDRFRGHLADGPIVLADWFDAAEQLYTHIGHVYIYATLRFTPNMADPIGASMNDRAGGLVGRAFAAVAFADPEMIAIGFETLRHWVQTEARLQPMAHYIDVLERQQEHVRSAEVEQVLGMVTDSFGTAESIHGLLVDTDLKFPAARTSTGDAVDTSQGNIDALLSDPDREVRRTAWEQYSDAHLAVRHTLAGCLSAGVKHHVFTSRVRGYPSSLAAALAPQFLPEAVFHNLIDTFKKHLPTWHRYWKLRREALGYERLHVYDIWAPLSTSSPEIPYSQAVDWITAGMAPLGDEYIAVMRQGSLDDRWVDIYPNQQKMSGAFSTGWPGTRPFILMSYTDDVYSLSTLAHELGHSMHSYYAWKAQPFFYANYGTFVAEVASNFNQALVRRHLMDHNPDRDFQIALIEESMKNFHRYFFIMPTLARFELEIHQRVERGEALTADQLIDLMGGLFAEAYGGEVEFDAERIGITWAEFPNHMYGNFYVWQYATGIAAAAALADTVVQDGAAAAERYLDFLRAGSSQYPLDVLKAAGVDMTSPAPVDQAFEALGGLIDRLEARLAV